MAIKVGFIGLGAMGLPMVSNLQRKGFDLNVYDIVQAPVDKLVKLGARKAATVAEAARNTDVVVTMLPATQHVETVVFGTEGVLASIGRGSILVDMSTIDAKGTDRVAEACMEYGIGFTDCPVGRSPRMPKEVSRCSWSVQTTRYTRVSNRC